MKPEDSDLSAHFTFEASKELPIHRWFYYKEAYAPKIVEHFLDYFSAGESVFDPFSGIGTTPLVAKSRNLRCLGMDVSPLAVFAGRAKCDDYSEADIADAKDELRSLFKTRHEPSFRWDFELFPPRRFFGRRNYNDICYVREKIEEMGNEKAGALFLLALLSILPQCGFFIKDGGVLRPEKSKRAMPLKDALKRKVKQMLSDLENAPVRGRKPEIVLGDSRNYSGHGEGYEVFITSPPYLNNIDYSKVYGLELSLLSMDKDASLKMRRESFRSFIANDVREAEAPPELGEAGFRFPAAAGYFADMERLLKNLHGISRKGGVMVVGNAVIQNEHIEVDRILCRMGERLGYECEIPLWKERVADVKPAKARVRESAVVFKK